MSPEKRPIRGENVVTSKEKGGTAMVKNREYADFYQATMMYAKAGKKPKGKAPIKLTPEDQAKVDEAYRAAKGKAGTKKPAQKKK